jgi:hypothetical protein
VNRVVRKGNIRTELSLGLIKKHVMKTYWEVREWPHEFFEINILHGSNVFYKITAIYRMSQKESSIFCEVTVSVILSKHSQYVQIHLRASLSTFPW